MMCTVAPRSLSAAISPWTDTRPVVRPHDQSVVRVVLDGGQAQPPAGGEQSGRATEGLGLDTTEDGDTICALCMHGVTVREHSGRWETVPSADGRSTSLTAPARVAFLAHQRGPVHGWCHDVLDTHVILCAPGTGWPEAGLRHHDDDRRRSVMGVCEPVIARKARAPAR
jgi:hypothetical protein